MTASLLARARPFVRDTLSRAGLLAPYRRLRQAAERRSHDRYLSKLIEAYASPFNVLREPFDKLGAVQRSMESGEIDARYERHRRDLEHAILATLPLPGVRSELSAALAAAAGTPAVRALGVLACDDPATPPEKIACVLHASAGLSLPARTTTSEALRTFLPQLIEPNGVPRFFEFDYIDDVQAILEARYAVGSPASALRGRVLLRALRAWMACEDSPEKSLPLRLKSALGDFSQFVPRRGEANPHVRQVIPDLFDEFCAMRGSDQPARFLEINRQYSARQHDGEGIWDSRDLSLLRGYERDHHALLRSLVDVMRAGRIAASDEVLIVGPRHVNEMHFFREHLGLRNTLGLDLFESDGGRIVAGDMHNMPFAAGRFKLVYVCNTLTYAYDARRVIQEICRVLDAPGYAMIIDSGNRVRGPDPLGRSDLMSADVLAQCFACRPYRALVKDRGKSLNPDWYGEQPCVFLELG